MVGFKPLVGVLAVALAAMAAAHPALAERNEAYGRPKLGGNVLSIFGKKSAKPKTDQFQANVIRPPKRTPDSLNQVPVDERVISAPLDDDQPEGNLAYKPEVLEPVYSAKLGPFVSSDALAVAIHDSLAAKTTAVRATKSERAAIIEAYTATGFRPLWVDGTGIDPRGQEVLATLAASAAEGMEPLDYLPPALGSFTDGPALADADLRHLADIDLGITAMALKFARDASGGRVIPNRLTTFNDIKPERVDPLVAIKVLTYSPFAAAYLKDLQPHHPAYGFFKQALAELRQLGDGGDLEAVAQGPKVKPGQSDARLPAVRARLKHFGFYPGSAEVTSIAFKPEDPAAPDFNLLSDADAAAIKQFQARSRINPTGNLDQITARVLNNYSGKADEERLLVNMERLRWLPRDLGKKYVFVNQAAYELDVVADNRSVWHTKVVVGRPDTQTTAFHDMMETVVFNPDWGVPASIIAKEMLPKLRKDSSYLDRNGYQVVDAKGKLVKSSAVNWWAYGDKPPFAVRQPASDDNALGEVKFLFPNAHSIYMHDTPSKNLFAKAARAFSHGCVRVENPRDFAAVLLNEDRKKIDREIDNGVSHSVKVPGQVAVHITYFTAWPDASGKIVYYPDVYGRDPSVLRAFGSLALAAK